MLRSHDHFSVAYQLNDDILDFIDDYENEQFNWCIHNFDQNIFDEYTIEDCKKIFYLEGYATKIFSQGIGELDKSLILLKESDSSHSLWEQHLLKMKIKFQKSIQEIEDYIFHLEVDIEKSDVLIKDNSIEKSLYLGISYIKKSIVNNQWYDYYNQGGISNVWATSFILSKIVTIPNFKKIFGSEIDLISQQLLKLKSNNNMWGYNTSWIDDADTTNFALISLYCSDYLGDFDHTNWLSYFKSHFFSTYNNEKYLLKSLDDERITNVAGWCANHLCVSAVSLYYLAVSKKYSEIRDKLLNNFLLQDLHKITAYWWSDGLYTLYYLFLSYKELGLLSEVEKIQNYVSRRIKEDFFEDSYGKNLFFSALSLEILIDNPKYINKANQLVSFLVKNQFDDGSWLESNSLCIPHPNDTNPKNENLLIQSFGVGVRSHEFNRLFTTISVLRSLYIWKNQI